MRSAVLRRRSSWTSLLLLVLTICLCLQCARANTEIRNFNLADDDAVFLTRRNEHLNGLEGQIIALRPSTSLHDIALSDGKNISIHVFALDLPHPHMYTSSIRRAYSDILGRSGRYTFRLCWPASHPAAFDISILRNVSASLHYAYVRVTRNAIYVDPFSAKAREAIPFSVIVEPLYLFAVPETSLSLLAFLAVLLPLIWALGVPSRLAEFVVRDPARAKDQ